MAESHEVDTADSPPSKSRQKRKALIVVASSLLLLFAVIWWMPRPNVVTQPVSYVRNADGSFSSEPANDRSGFEVAMDAGQLSATNSISMVSNSSHSGAAWFACDTILVLNQSDNLLVQQSADRLVEELKSSGQFQSVRYYPTGHQPEEGIEKPDLYLVLNLESLEETGIATTAIHAVINANLGVAPARSSNTYIDSQTDPTVNFNSQIELDHRSNFVGVESSGAKFRAQGASISKALAEHMLKRIKDLKDDHPSPGKLPDILRPAWVKADQFQFLKQFDAKQFSSTHGPFLKNDTFWQVEGINISDRLLNAVHDELKPAGWKGDTGDIGRQYLRMSRDGQILTVFTERQTFGSTSDIDAKKQSKIDRFWIHNQTVLTKKERHEAYDNLLSQESVNVSTLLALKQMATSDQLNQVIEKFKDDPPAIVSSWVELAKYHFARKQKTEGLAALRCAHLLHRLLRGNDQQIDRLMDDQKISQTQIRSVTKDTLEALGIFDATTLAEPIELEIGPERIAALAAKTTNNKWRFVAYVFGPQDVTGAVEYTFVQLEDHGAMWSNGTWEFSGDHTRTVDLGEHRVTMKTIQDPGSAYPSKVIFAPASQPLLKP